MERFEVRTGQLELIGGIAQDHSDLIAVVEASDRPPLAARQVGLYMVAEPDGSSPRGATLGKLALRVFRQAFYADRGFSLTSALRSAIRAANKALYEHNVKLSPAERVTIGMTAAIVHEGALYVVQVQPAQAYVLSEGVVRALPLHPAWDGVHVSPPLFIRSGALGASLFIEPELYRCPLRTGEGALLCSSALAPLLSRTEVETLLGLGDPQAVMTQLTERLLAAGAAEAHALALFINPAPRRASTRRLTSTENGAKASVSLPDEPWLARLARRLGLRQPALQTSARSSSDVDPLYTLPDQPAHSPNPPSRPAPLDLGESLSASYERRRREQAERAPLRYENLPLSAFLGEEQLIEGIPRRIDLADTAAISGGRPYQPRYIHRPIVDMTWGERLMLPVHWLRIAVEERLQRPRFRRPAPPPPISRRHGLSYRRTRPPFPWGLFLGLTIVIAALIFYGLVLTRQNEQRIVLEYFAAADARLEQVRAAPSDSAALHALELVRQVIDQLRATPSVTETNPALWLRYQELQREYERALAAVQRLTFFDDPVVLAALPAGRFADVIVPPPVGSITDTAAIEAARFIYALDTDPQSARLYRIPRDGGAPVPYLMPGQAVGNTVVGVLRAAVWRIDQVVAVDQTSRGFGYYFRTGNTWNYSKFGASEIWTLRDRLDVEEYAGNLYVWGAQPNEVLRYRSGSYGDPPDYWLDAASVAEVDLSTVVDMSVDGSIYLLRSNGVVLVFSQGRLVGEVTPEPISPPIATVTRFFVTGDNPESGYFFLLDSLGERVIQMEKVSGRIVQQIQVRPTDQIRLAELAAIAVDASGARPILYLANAGQIVRAELPPPPRPFRESMPAGSRR